ncbi:uncharacterized protein ARMOST_19322 [Armillaria ostoyae]|uniref:Uncharacterized protein n=1 Tax=Armillaria ostoyae TaxID=47428 RepID=A0A284S4A8_ARMOS|nr:uncharacterized protein ARMOST_19322 [Armillaria ostoyae]
MPLCPLRLLLSLNRPQPSFSTLQDDSSTLPSKRMTLQYSPTFLTVQELKIKTKISENFGLRRANHTLKGRSSMLVWASPQMQIPILRQDDVLTSAEQGRGCIEWTLYGDGGWRTVWVRERAKTKGHAETRFPPHDATSLLPQQRHIISWRHQCCMGKDPSSTPRRCIVVPRASSARHEDAVVYEVEGK